MCKDNWITDKNNAEVIIVAPLVRPAEVIEHLEPGPERLPDAGFQKLFFGRDF